MTTTLARDRVCVNCGKVVARDRKSLCNNCGEQIAIRKGPPIQTQSVFRGVSRADATRQAEADVLLARSNGYDVESQAWVDDRGTPVLTVVYRFTGTVPKPAAAPAAARGAQPWAVLAIAAGAVVSLGAFLPWISATTGFVSISRSGVDGGGDGLLFLGGGMLLILLGIAAFTGTTRGVSKLIMLLGVVGLLGTYFEYQSIQTRIEDLADNVVASIGLGIWAIGAGSLLALVAGVQVDEHS